MRIAFGTLLLTASLSGSAVAQGAYVEVSGIVSSQNGVPSSEFDGTGVGGTTIGVGGAAAVHITPYLSVGIEVSLPSRIEVIQNFDHILVWRQDDRYRDAIVSPVVHLRAGSTRIAPELVAGASFVNEDDLERRADCGSEFSNAPCGAYGQWQSRSLWTLGVVFGADVPIPVTRTFALVPQFRMYLVDRSSPMVTIGTSNVVVRPAFAGRWTF